MRWQTRRESINTGLHWERGNMSRIPELGHCKDTYSVSEEWNGKVDAVDRLAEEPPRAWMEVFLTVVHGIVILHYGISSPCWTIQRLSRSWNYWRRYLRTILLPRACVANINSASQKRSPCDRSQSVCHRTRKCLSKSIIEK